MRTPKQLICGHAMREAFRRVIGDDDTPAVVMRALEGSRKTRRAVEDAYQQIMRELEATNLHQE